jgi:hypothetical protein
MVSRGFTLKDIWAEMPWDGDMPEEFIQAFAEIYRRLDNEKLQKLASF